MIALFLTNFQTKEFSILRLVQGDIRAFHNIRIDIFSYLSLRK